MRKALAILVLATVGCSNGGTPTVTQTPDEPPFQFFEEALEGTVLTQADAGDKWETEDDAAASTVLIGGDIGPGNIDVATAEATSAFNEKEGTGYLSNTLLLVEDEATARTIMAKHEEGDADRQWTQERTDGGNALHERTGRVTDVPIFGDETYTATIDVTISEPNGDKVERKVEYVAYRIRNLLAFVVTQDARAAVYARRQESKVAKLIGQ